LMSRQKHSIPKGSLDSRLRDAVRFKYGWIGASVLKIVRGTSRQNTQHDRCGYNRP
jgi:hypothetical protein